MTTYIEDEVKTLRSYIFNSNPLEYIKKVKEIEDKIFDGECEAKDNKNEDLSDYEYFTQFKEVKIAQLEDNMFFRCIDNIKKAFNKNPDNTSENISTWEFYEDDSKTITTVGKINIYCSLKKILLVYLDLNNLNNILKDKIGSSIIIKNLSPFKSIVSSHLKMPFPYKDRYSVTLGNTFLDYDNKTIYLFSKSITPIEIEELFDIKDLKIKDSSGNHVNYEDADIIDLKFNYISIKKVSTNSFELYLGTNANANLTGIPHLVANKIIKEIAKSTSLEFKKIMEDKSNDYLFEDYYTNNKNFFDNILAEFDF